MTPQEMVREFHEAFGVAVADSPIDGPIPLELRQLRESLVKEEFNEFRDALWNGDLVEIADALADLTYVVYGTAVSLGINLDAVVKEVHRSNMTKLDEDGSPIYRSDGKVLKGPNFEAPNILEVM
jgi:predicted HAD superfamily Cof-like phosphohydrolase